jgi:uncharacterized protein with HEPN domain
MSKPRDKQRVEDILTSISIIEAFVKDKSLLEFENDVMLHSAVQYQFLIIGEAAGAISPEILKRHDFPWFLPKSFRNFIIHEYHNVKLERIYHTAFELEDLKVICEKILILEFK